MLTMQHIARNRNMSSAHRRLAAPSAKTQEEELLEEVKTLDESSPELETPSSSERPCPPAQHPVVENNDGTSATLACLHWS